MSEQKIWVEKIPKNCWECPCFRDDIDFPCGLSDGIQDYFKDEIDGGKCPLHSIKAHDRELVKEVCEKITERYNLECKPITDEFGDTQYGYAMISAKDLKQFLDQIQKEFEK